MRGVAELKKRQSPAAATPAMSSPAAVSMEEVIIQSRAQRLAQLQQLISDAQHKLEHQRSEAMAQDARQAHLQELTQRLAAEKDEAKRWLARLKRKEQDLLEMQADAARKAADLEKKRETLDAREIALMRAAGGDRQAPAPLSAADAQTQHVCVRVVCGIALSSLRGGRCQKRDADGYWIGS